MSANTVNQNKGRFENVFEDEFWLFGYGSLIFKADFDYLDKRIATLMGWERRFWQGSHDHRGTEQNPGRVVTLIENPGNVCLGMAYRINQSVLNHLDHREKNGYLRFVSELRFDDGSSADGLIYIAGPDNEAFLGKETELNIAKQIAQSEGPSGKNSDYLIGLAGAIRALGGSDPHVFAIERCVRDLLTQKNN